jgi:hypothetical protein
VVVGEAREGVNTPAGLAAEHRVAPVLRHPGRATGAAALARTPTGAHIGGSGGARGAHAEKGPGQHDEVLLAHLLRHLRAICAKNGERFGQRMDESGLA